MIPRVMIGLCAPFLAASLHAATAHADPHPWQFDVKASYVVLGDHAKRSTGGLMPSLKHLALVAACGVRFLRTLAWTGVSVEPAVAGRFSF
ncbi:hypothetical protein [Polyangium jinanense]|uniref:Uncharacterized protein n=1 Tax=Polyangium jinanense TaxID=2829994 RepID=A0A9X3WZZ7_9BACT|nr:hypothetical protein [Polyangium jinanense]MDC3979698.1 hypothetical protein [Polyangium jinanense]